MTRKEGYERRGYAETCDKREEGKGEEPVRENRQKERWDNDENPL